MSADREKYEAAELAFLASEGVDAASRIVDLERLGSRLRVLDAGEGPPVLFVPGVMTGGAVFAGLVPRLDGFRCIMVDRPGVGLSPPLPSPPNTLSEHEHVGDVLLVDVLDGLGIERSHIVATSQGGWTGFRSLAAHPDRFDRYVGLAYQMGARLEKLPLSMKIPPIRWLIPNRLRATRWLVQAMLKSAGMRGAFESGRFSDEMLDWMVAQLRYTDTFGYDSLHSPRPQFEHAPKLLANVDIPVHLFWGTDDIFAGEAMARELAASLPNATVQMVPGAGHAPWLDEPELAAEAVLRHLSG